MLWHPLKLNNKRMLPSGVKELLLIPANNISYELRIFRQRGTDVTPKYEERDLFSCHENSSDVIFVMGLVPRAKGLQVGRMAVMKL